MIEKSQLEVGEEYVHQFRGALIFDESCAEMEKRMGISTCTSFFYIKEDDEYAELSLSLIKK